eukprot:g34940.t1
MATILDLLDLALVVLVVDSRDSMWFTEVTGFSGPRTDTVKTYLEGVIMMSKKTKWACPTCTYNNDGGNSCEMCGSSAPTANTKTSVSDPYDVGLPPRAWSDMERQGYYPIIRQAQQLTGLESRMPRYNEFALSPTFDPILVDDVSRLGFFPMSINLYRGVFAFAIKVHQNRCVMDLTKQDVHVSKANRKKAKKFWVTINKAYDAVVDMIVEQHGLNWLCPLLQKSFKEIFTNPTAYHMRIFSIEVWMEEQQDNKQKQQQQKPPQPNQPQRQPEPKPKPKPKPAHPAGQPKTAATVSSFSPGKVIGGLIDRVVGGQKGSKDVPDSGGERPVGTEGAKGQSEASGLSTKKSKKQKKTKKKGQKGQEGSGVAGEKEEGKGQDKEGGREMVMAGQQRYKMAAVGQPGDNVEIVGDKVEIVGDKVEIVGQGRGETVHEGQQGGETATLAQQGDRMEIDRPEGEKKAAQVDQQGDEMEIDRPEGERKAAEVGRQGGKAKGGDKQGKKVKAAAASTQKKEKKKEKQESELPDLSKLTLVAGELGYMHGSVYTSLTGARKVDGSGTVQLMALVKAMKKTGVKLWDLGMSMSYKEDLGATSVPRAEFLATYRKLAQDVPSQPYITSCFPAGPADGPALLNAQYLAKYCVFSPRSRSDEQISHSFSLRSGTFAALVSIFSLTEKTTPSARMCM